MPYVVLNDIQLHYALDGDVHKPVLILSNSLGTTLDMWLPQLARFRRDYRVLRYDTRGHGNSTVTPGPYSTAQLAGDVIALMDHLQIAQAHFCGLSMGGQTGMWLAIHHPKRLRKLVLSNTAAYIGPPDNWNARVAAVQKNGIAPLADAIVSRWLTPEFARQHPRNVEHLLAMLKASPPVGYAAGCMAVRDADLREQVKRIAAPTLVIAGSADLPTPPADGRYLQQQIKGAHYVELAAAHLSNQECVDEFSDVVLEFLARS